MNWIEQLYKTYVSCYGMDEDAILADDHSNRKPRKPLLPPFHTLQNSHLEIRIDTEGNFIDAGLVDKEEIIIPCTEKSGSRTSGEEPHPLCDKIQYVAEDYAGSKRPYFRSYRSLINKWSVSEYSHPMVKAVCSYINKGTVIADLIASGKQIIRENEDPGDLFVRWKIEIPGEYETRCWKNHSLFESWMQFVQHQDVVEGICMVTGEVKPIAINHPKRIRNSGDGGKLISSNDRSGFTFLGRFLLNTVMLNGKKEEIAVQSASVSTEVSQKAHSALRWLIDRQSYRDGDQVIVSWAVSGKQIPDPLYDSNSLFDESDEERIKEIDQVPIDDAGQTFARKLSKKIAGYQQTLGESTDIIVMGLDSAGLGRISITYYRELDKNEFFERIESWYSQMAWYFHEFYKQKIVKTTVTHGHRLYVPAPRMIAEACYGKRIRKDDKLRRSTIERLLPCIIDGQQIPLDLVEQAVKRASNKAGLDHWDWERTLSVACALFRCHSFRITNQNKTEYSMALENERTDRDYLYGRLLAVAEHIEETALYAANEKRETSAARLMQRFADYPFSTWRNIESSLVPYKSRLQASRPGTLFKMKNLMDEIHAKFQPGDYEKDTRLSGAYLLGYHCQRLTLAFKKPIGESGSETEIND